MTVSNDPAWASGHPTDLPPEYRVAALCARAVHQSLLSRGIGQTLHLTIAGRTGQRGAWGAVMGWMLETAEATADRCRFCVAVHDTCFDRSECKLHHTVVASSFLPGMETPYKSSTALQSKWLPLKTERRHRQRTQFCLPCLTKNISESHR